MTAGFRARATKRRPTKVAATPATAAKNSCHSTMAAKRSSTAPPLGERGENAHVTAGLGSRQDAVSRGSDSWVDDATGEGAGQDQRPPPCSSVTCRFIA